MFSKSFSVISVPMDTSAAVFTCSSISSGKISDNSVSAAFDLTPIVKMILANATESVTIFANSGKCHPYHSLHLMA